MLSDDQVVVARTLSACIRSVVEGSAICQQKRTNSGIQWELDPLGSDYRPHSVGIGGARNCFTDAGGETKIVADFARGPLHEEQWK